LGFKLKREWFRSIESLLGLRKDVADFITMKLTGSWAVSGDPVKRLVMNAIIYNDSSSVLFKKPKK
jgi:hypothetical protein